WVGPFRLRGLLEHCMDERQPWPPESNGVYVVSERSWSGVPTKAAGILYAGGNTSQSPLFVIRVGLLISGMVRLYPGGLRRYSGGRWLYGYCTEKGFPPLDLFLGWVEGIPCSRCAEAEVHRALEPSLCKKVPARCTNHTRPRRVCLPAEGQ